MLLIFQSLEESKRFSSDDENQQTHMIRVTPPSKKDEVNLHSTSISLSILLFNDTVIFLANEMLEYIYYSNIILSLMYTLDFMILGVCYRLFSE